ncbi:N-acetylmuramoyl-L-alanine amidase [Ekhidna sp.]|uniref:N-acetylmuramoyl-L-alanine amidase n=1 Tax=Ekhidna sp. TaxID=2608089 RepID=UPI003B500E01
MRTKLLIILLLVFGNALGQHQIRSSSYLSSYQWHSEDTVIAVSSENLITAVVIKSDREAVFSVVGNPSLLIPKDEDVENPTYFISLPTPVRQVNIEVPIDHNFSVHLITSGNAPEISQDQYRSDQQSICEESPESVSQSVWRNGLPDPNYTRSFHEVFHNVVHHSAGSNSNTDYTQVVRDIYLYHTQVNGWSDIGYNYLIAQDGTLYAGRDPGSGSQDQVRGAHFCGSNSGTLGVCLLGNYETVTPSSVSIVTLEELLTYQLYNQGREPFQTYNHSLGNLETIVGHRDGCSTLCPGENVYSLLNNISSAVQENLEDCTTEIPFAILTDTLLIKVGEEILLQASGNYDTYYWSLPGGHPFILEGEEVRISYSRPGYYDVTLVGIEGTKRDTILQEDLIHVSQLESEPIIFPNPAYAFSEIIIDYKEEIQKAELMDINGRTIDSWESEKIKIGGVDPGIYLVMIQTESRLFREKIIIN